MGPRLWRSERRAARKCQYKIRNRLRKQSVTTRDLVKARQSSTGTMTSEELLPLSLAFIRALM